MEPSQNLNARRAQVYGTLARLFRSPDDPDVDGLAADLRALRGALEQLGADEGMQAAIDGVEEQMAHTALRELERGYECLVERSSDLLRRGGADGSDPDAKEALGSAVEELADIATLLDAQRTSRFRRSDTVDRISTELEFMQLLASREATAEAEGRRELSGTCRAAARSLLGQCLARHASSLSRFLEAVNAHPFYVAASLLVERFLAHERERLGVS